MSMGGTGFGVLTIDMGGTMFRLAYLQRKDESRRLFNRFSFYEIWNAPIWEKIVGDTTIADALRANQHRIYLSKIVRSPAGMMRERRYTLRDADIEIEVNLEETRSVPGYGWAIPDVIIFKGPQSRLYPDEYPLTEVPIDNSWHELKKRIEREFNNALFWFEKAKEVPDPASAAQHQIH